MYFVNFQTLGNVVCGLYFNNMDFNGKGNKGRIPKRVRKIEDQHYFGFS